MHPTSRRSRRDIQVPLATDTPAARRTTGVFYNPLRVTAIIGVLGLALTAVISWTAWRIDRNNERRLLQVQTKQAAEVLTLAITGIQSPLQTAVDIASATSGSPQRFTSFMSSYTGNAALFTTASLWQTNGSSLSLVASVGHAPGLAPTSPVVQQFLARAAHSPTFLVTSFSAGGLQNIGYALADPKTSSYVVYAERTIPANRRVPVESNSAFADLHYATYLGSTTASSALETTDVDPTRLPLSGNTDRATVPFGDTTLTLATAPARHLGGAFEARLPWLLLIAGLLLTLGAAALVRQLVRRRVLADKDAATITELFGQLGGLYAEQRTIAETLQHALLPQTNPAIPNLEIASRYVAGARGVDVGGDWYSIIAIDDTHFAFVVGDVSGRGVDAAAIMARIRFTVRAYLLEGHPPAVALELCSRQLDIMTDGHFATVLVGLGDLTSRQITFANAGHLNPLMASPSRVGFIDTTVGPPLGVAVSAYPSTTVVMEPESMLIAFTDGLVERRDQDIDIGLQRLAATVTPSELPINDLLTNVLTTLTHGDTEDDIAILAFKWHSRS